MSNKNNLPTVEIRFNEAALEADLRITPREFEEKIRGKGYEPRLVLKNDKEEPSAEDAERFREFRSWWNAIIIPKTSAARIIAASVRKGLEQDDV